MATCDDSFHPISSSPFGVYPSVSFHAPASLIKCRGSLVVRPPGIPDYFKIYQTSCCQKQSSHKHPEVSSRSRISQNSPDYMFRTLFRFFIPRFQRVIHDSCSPSNHVKTKHWEKQHHAVTSLFCRSLVAWWTAGNSDAVVCFCQPSSVEIELNAVKLPLVFVGAGKTPHLIGDTHVHRDLSTTFHVTTQHWGKHHAVTSLFCRSLVACWTARNSDAVVCRYRSFPWNLRWTPWNFPWFCVGASNTTSQTFEHHVPCHNTAPWKTARKIKDHFLVRKIVPQRLTVCGKPWIKGYQQGGNSPSSYVAQRSYGSGGRVHGRMNLYLLSVWDPANPRTGLPFIMSCHAFSRVGSKVMLHTWWPPVTIHFISFHLPPSGCIQVCVCVCVFVFEAQASWNQVSAKPGFGVFAVQQPPKK